MTLSEIKSIEKPMLTPTDVSEILGVHPHSINRQAHDDIGALGFNASLVGTRVLIPRLAFIKWVEGQ